MGTVGKLKQGIFLNVYFRGLPAEGKWVVIKQEKWGVKKKLHIIKSRSLQNQRRHLKLASFSKQAEFANRKVKEKNQHCCGTAWITELCNGVSLKGTENKSALGFTCKQQQVTVPQINSKAT